MAKARDGQPKQARKRPSKPARVPKGPGAPVARRGSGAKSGAKSRAADAVAKRARAAGAKGRRLTAAKQALRDSLIVARAAQDWPVAAIAAEVELSENQVRAILREKRGVRSPLEETPMQLLEDLARGFKLSVGDLEAMAAAWAEDNPNAALGAKKASNDARRHFMDLMATVGKLPTDLEMFQQEGALRRIADEMVATMDRLLAGEITAGEAREVFDRMTGQVTAAALPEAAG